MQSVKSYSHFNISGVGSGATTPLGEYVPMMKRMPPRGGNIPGAAGLFPAFGGNWPLYTPFRVMKMKAEEQPKPVLGNPHKIHQQAATKTGSVQAQRSEGGIQPMR
jgi:hypothetical protein